MVKFQLKKNIGYAAFFGFFFPMLRKNMNQNPDSHLHFDKAGCSNNSFDNDSGYYKVSKNAYNEHFIYNEKSCGNALDFFEKSFSQDNGCYYYNEEFVSDYLKAQVDYNIPCKDPNERVMSILSKIFDRILNGSTHRSEIEKKQIALMIQQRKKEQYGKKLSMLKNKVKKEIDNLILVLDENSQTICQIKKTIIEGQENEDNKLQINKKLKKYKIINKEKLEILLKDIEKINNIKKIKRGEGKITFCDAFFVESVKENMSFYSNVEQFGGAPVGFRSLICYICQKEGKESVFLLFNKLKEIIRPRFQMESEIYKGFQTKFQKELKKNFF